jgi:hypothetical protein
MRYGKTNGWKIDGVTICVEVGENSSRRRIVGKWYT